MADDMELDQDDLLDLFKDDFQDCIPTPIPKAPVTSKLKPPSKRSRGLAPTASTPQVPSTGVPSVSAQGQGTEIQNGLKHTSVPISAPSRASGTTFTSVQTGQSLNASRAQSTSSGVCSHPAFISGLCVVCGTERAAPAVDEGDDEDRADDEEGIEPQVTVIRHLHRTRNLALEVTAKEAQRVTEHNLQRLLADRKLVLILDLDHTLLNSVRLNDVSAEEAAVLHRVLAAESATLPADRRTLHHLWDRNLWTKLRPGVFEFLEQIEPLYQLHIYTMGDQYYAAEIARILDPKRRFFAGRVISSADSSIAGIKDLDVVLAAEQAVIILDDSAGVWPKHGRNLIQVERYHFFPPTPGAGRTGYSGFRSLLEDAADEGAEAGAMAAATHVLKTVHAAFFSEAGGVYDLQLARRDVRFYLARVRQKILEGCVLLFSHCWSASNPEPHQHPLWALAESLGADIRTEYSATEVTHVVAGAEGTQKVVQARQDGRHVVSPNWLFAASATWQRPTETEYPPLRKANNRALAHSTHMAAAEVQQGVAARIAKGITVPLLQGTSLPEANVVPTVEAAEPRPETREGVAEVSAAEALTAETGNAGAVEPLKEPLQDLEPLSAAEIEKVGSGSGGTSEQLVETQQGAGLPSAAEMGSEGSGSGVGAAQHVKTPQEPGPVDTIKIEGLGKGSEGSAEEHVEAGPRAGRTAGTAEIERRGSGSEGIVDMHVDTRVEEGVDGTPDVRMIEVESRGEEDTARDAGLEASTSAIVDVELAGLGNGNVETAAVGVGLEDSVVIDAHSVGRRELLTPEASEVGSGELGNGSVGKSVLEVGVDRSAEVASGSILSGQLAEESRGGASSHGEVRQGESIVESAEMGAVGSHHVGPEGARGDIERIESAVRVNLIAAEQQMPVSVSRTVELDSGISGSVGVEGGTMDVAGEQATVVTGGDICSAQLAGERGIGMAGGEGSTAVADRDIHSAEPAVEKVSGEVRGKESVAVAGGGVRSAQLEATLAWIAEFRGGHMQKAEAEIEREVSVLDGEGVGAIMRQGGEERSAVGGECESQKVTMDILGRESALVHSRCTESASKQGEGEGRVVGRELSRGELVTEPATTSGKKRLREEEDLAQITTGQQMESGGVARSVEIISVEDEKLENGSLEHSRSGTLVFESGTSAPAAKRKESVFIASESASKATLVVSCEGSAEVPVPQAEKSEENMDLDENPDPTSSLHLQSAVSS